MSINTYSLCTLDDVRNYYGIEGVDNEEDAIIESIINNLSIAVENYIGRNILSRSYTDYYDGYNINKLYTNQYPITSISGVWIDSSWSWDNDTIVDSDNYRISSDSRYIVFTDGTLYDSGEQSIKVIYTAGYTTVPGDIKQVLIEEIVRVYKHRTDVDVMAKTLEDGSITRYNKDWLPTTFLVLNKYKSLGIS